MATKPMIRILRVVQAAAPPDPVDIKDEVTPTPLIQKLNAFCTALDQEIDMILSM